MRGTEAVEEVDERNAALNGGEVSDSAEVHYFLGVGLCEHCISGLTACIYVGVVAEDVERVGSYAACRNVNYVRKELTGDLVHVRDHEKESLRCGVGLGGRGCSERTVNGACGTCLGLHLHDLYAVAEDVSRALTEDVLIGRRPCVGDFGHRRGRRDRVDRGNLRERIADVRGGCISVHGNLFSCHCVSSIYK